MSRYHVVASFEIEAPIDRVWAALVEPHWWEVAWANRLQGRRPLQTSATRREAPEFVEWMASGPVDGSGQWELIDLEETTAARFSWKFRVTGPRARLTHPFNGRRVLATHLMAVRDAAELLAVGLGATLQGFRTVAR